MGVVLDSHIILSQFHEGTAWDFDRIPCNFQGVPKDLLFRVGYCRFLVEFPCNLLRESVGG